MNTQGLTPVQQQMQDAATRQKAARIAQEVSAEVASRFEDKLNAETFPADRLSDEWKRSVGIAIDETTPLTQQVSLKAFAKVVACNPEDGVVNFFQFGVLSNALEAVSRKKLGLSRENYKSFIDETVAQIAWWRQSTNEWHSEITQTVQQEIAMKYTALNQSNGKNNLAKA